MVTDLQIAQAQLPVEPKELARFVLVGEEQVKAMRAEIRAIQKLKLADEVWKQKQKELQWAQEQVTDAKVRIGVLFNNMPKQTGGDHGNQYTGGKAESGKKIGGDPFAKTPEKPVKTRQEAAEELGFSHIQVKRFQQMAKHPEAVEAAKAEARLTGKDLTTQGVLDKIREQRTADNTVSFNQYREAREDERYYQDMEDERLYKQLDGALRAIEKQLPTEPEAFEAMWRWSIDPADDLERMREAVERLQAIAQVFIRKGGKGDDRAGVHAQPGREHPG